MNASAIFVALLIALSFGGWPILARLSGANGAWVAILAIIGSFVGATLPTLYRREFSGVPPTKAILIVLLAGVLNGLGLYLYSRKVADTAVPTAQFVTAVCIFVLFWAPILDWLLRGQVPTLTNCAGYVCAGAAVYLLSRQ